jgi:hypothetical protein
VKDRLEKCSPGKRGKKVLSVYLYFSKKCGVKYGQFGV